MIYPLWLQPQMVLLMLQPLACGAHHQVRPLQGLGQGGEVSGHLQNVPGMGGHGTAEVFDLAGVDQGQITKAEVLHRPGHRAHIALVEGLDQDDL